MRFRLLYQQPLHLPVPFSSEQASPPNWTWPVGLSDGRTILTLLWKRAGRQPSTLILELSPTGDAAPWLPGVGYPAPVIACALESDDLIGFDLVKTGKVYACRPDGAHLWTLDASVQMESPLALSALREHAGKLHWIDADGKPRAANLTRNPPRLLPDAVTPAAPAGDVHFPHTHFNGNRLYVFEFEPQLRITVYALHPE